MHNQLPPNAKLVYKGIIFDIYQWEQTMFDGSIQIFERQKRPDTVLVIPVVGDRILVQEQKQPQRGRWVSLPGGRRGENENSLDTAQRELLEETGYASNDWQLWKVFDPVPKMVWSIYTFIARKCVFKQEQHLEAGEKIKNILLTFDQFLMLSEDERFQKSVDMVNYMLRVRLDEQKKEEFRKLLFK